MTAGAGGASDRSTSLRRIRASLDRRRALRVEPPGAGEVTTSGTMLSADEGAVSIAVGAEACGAGIAGRRADACTANRSAADFVRRYPAVYTARTAAEPSATRLFATFLWDPLSDTALHYSESDAVLGRCHSFAFFNHSEGLRPSARLRLSFGDVHRSLGEGGTPLHALSLAASATARPRRSLGVGGPIAWLTRYRSFADVRLRMAVCEMRSKRNRRERVRNRPVHAYPRCRSVRSDRQESSA